MKEKLSEAIFMLLFLLQNIVLHCELLKKFAAIYQSSCHVQSCILWEAGPTLTFHLGLLDKCLSETSLCPSFLPFLSCNDTCKLRQRVCVVFFCLLWAARNISRPFFSFSFRVIFFTMGSKYFSTMLAMIPHRWCMDFISLILQYLDLDVRSCRAT